MNTQEYCPFCAAPVKKRLECDCKESVRNRKRMQKPMSSRVKLFHYYGRCPKCGTMVTELDINKYVRFECPECGTQEEYQKVKEGAWK